MATAAVSAVKVKAIVIASVAAVAVGGIGVGVGIALHNEKEDEPVKVAGTAEETTEVPTEKVTEELIEVPTEEVTEELTEAPTEPLTEENWDKTVYEEAAIKLLENMYEENTAFMDLNNDGIPELLVSTYYENDSRIYEYEGGEYILSKETSSF